MLKLLIDDRWIGPNGIGRYAREVTDRFSLERVSVTGLGKVWPIKSPLTPIYLSGAITRLRPDIFWSPGFIPPAISRIPFVITIHDLIHLQFGSQAQKLYYNSVIRPLSKKAFRIVTVSEYSRREIINWTGLNEDQVAVALNGVSSQFTVDGPRLNVGRPYLLYVGNRRKHKNLDRMVRAFAASQISQDIVLALSGDPDGQLVTLAKQVGVADRLLFLGKVDDKDLSSVYRGALGLVFVSLYEGFGLPTLEAMSCGTPVLTSNITASVEIAGDAAICVDPYNIDDIAQGIDRLINDVELRKALHTAGIERARTFTWGRTAGIVWDVLRDAAA